MKKKEKKIRPKYLKICPKCKSLDVESKLNVGVVFGMPQKYTCKKCGYSNFFFPEIDINEKQAFSRTLENKKFSGPKKAKLSLGKLSKKRGSKMES